MRFKSVRGDINFDAEAASANHPCPPTDGQTYQPDNSLTAFDTKQMKAIRATLTAFPEPPPEASPLAYYDPKVHARNTPIRRKWLEPDESAVKIARKQFLPKRDPRQPILSYRYDWKERKVVRSGDPNDVEVVFRNAANGVPPGFDRARAITIREMDGGHHPELLAAFCHAYTDRNGGAYPTITLYDAWTSGATMEMPDVDVLGIVHDVLGDWESWVAPLDDSDHGTVYPMVARLYRKSRRYRTLREALADARFMDDPWAGRFLVASRNLHALWAAKENSVVKLTAELPDADAQESWFDQWVATCQSDGTVFQEGVQRRTQTEADMEKVVKALEDALRATGALE